MSSQATTIVSPTYVPDLVHATLDLLLDGENGIWHLTNKGAISWHDLACQVADMAKLDIDRDHLSRPRCPGRHQPHQQARGSVRPLDRAIEDFVQYSEPLRGLEEAPRRSIVPLVVLR